VDSQRGHRLQVESSQLSCCSTCERELFNCDDVSHKDQSDTISDRSGMLSLMVLGPGLLGVTGSRASALFQVYYALIRSRGLKIVRRLSIPSAKRAADSIAVTKAKWA
jgi:hypothetical protein